MGWLTRLKPKPHLEVPPIDQLPTLLVERAIRFSWWVQSYRVAGPVLLSAAITWLVTLSTLYEWPARGLLDLAQWGGLKWALLALVPLGLLILGHFYYFRPTYAEMVRERDIARGESREYARALQSALDELLRRLLNHVSGDCNDCRLSAYSVEDDEFVLLARASVNPLHERRGRTHYPLNKGVIGRAWQHVRALVNFEHTQRDLWEQQQHEEQDFTVDEAKGLSMQSNSLLALRLDSPTQKVGVIVFECTEPAEFNLKTQQKLERSLLVQVLISMVASSHQHFQRVRERQSERADGPSKTFLEEPAWKSSPAALIGPQQPRGVR